MKLELIFMMKDYNQEKIHVQFPVHSVMLIDSVCKSNKRYYSQVLLEVCKYIVKHEAIKIYILLDLCNSDSDCNCDDGSVYIFFLFVP